jgi:hypothetical protein
MKRMLLVLTMLQGLPALAQLDSYRGQILYDSRPFPPGGTMEFKKALSKAAARTELAKDGDAWSFYFVAVFKKAPGAEDVNLVFYDLTGGKREYVNVYEIKVNAGQESLLSQVVLGRTEGFVAGHKYQALVTRLINGQETAYAKGTVKLK